MTTDVGESSSPKGRTFDQKLGEAIHQELWRRKIKQADFADHVLGITQAALSNKLHGKRPFFAGELTVIAATLGLEVSDLLPEVEVDPMPDPPPGDSAPSRTRTYDLRIKRPPVTPLPVRKTAA